MPAILTLTFNPCIDVYTSVAAFRPDRKLRCSSPTMHPGGGGINVARAITKLGGAAVCLYPAGGASGDYLRRMLDEEGVLSEVVRIAAATRENLIVTDESSGLTYQLNMPGPMLDVAAVDALLDILAASAGIRYLVVSGSPAPGMPEDIWERLAAIAASKDIKIIADTSGEALKKALQCGVYMIKPSIHELIAISEKTGDERLIRDMARALVDKGSCKVVVVSMGSAGALLVTTDMVRQIAAPAVRANGAVGAGDSMVAGIVHALQAGKGLAEAVSYGCVCGAAATLHPGTSLCNLRDVEYLLKLSGSSGPLNSGNLLTGVIARSGMEA